MPRQSARNAASKQIITLIILGCHLQASAGQLCQDIFINRSELSFDSSTLDASLEKLDTLNSKQKTLERLTRNTLGRATDLEIQLFIKQLRFNIQNGIPKKTLKDIQGLSVDLAMAYIKIKLPEPRVVLLRAKEDLRPEETSELAKLEKNRAQALKYIGKNFVKFRAIVRELESYKTDPKKAEYKDSAAEIEKYLGITESWLKQNASLLEFVNSHLAPGVDPLSILRPTMDQLNDLYIGRDANLSSSERTIGLFTKLDHDIMAQRIDNFIRGALETFGDQAFGKIYHTLLSKIGKGKLSDEQIKEFSDRLGRAADDLQIIKNHYEGVEHLIASESKIEEKFKFFMEMNAKFGSTKEGVPLFAMTLARRGADSLKIWTELTEYITAQQPGFIIGPNFKLTDAMKKAEESRVLGLLPSVYSPNARPTFTIAKTLIIAGLSAFIASQYFSYSTITDTIEKLNPKEILGTDKPTEAPPKEKK